MPQCDGTSMEKSIQELLNDILKLQTAASKLAKLVDSEQQAIRDSDFDAVEAVLNQKQVFLDQLTGLPELKDCCQRAAGLMDPASLSQFTNAIRELEEEIMALSRREGSTIGMMKEHHGKLASELRALTQNQQAASPYSRASQPASKSRIDISS